MPDLDPSTSSSPLFLWDHEVLFRRLKRSSAFLLGSSAMDAADTTVTADDVQCLSNCSGRGDCVDGLCHCQIQFDGESCEVINFAYHVAFASIFFVIALTSLIQLVMCIHAGKLYLFI